MLRRKKRFPAYAEDDYCRWMVEYGDFLPRQWVTHGPNLGVTILARASCLKRMPCFRNEVYKVVCGCIP